MGSYLEYKVELRRDGKIVVIKYLPNKKAVWTFIRCLFPRCSQRKVLEELPLTVTRGDYVVSVVELFDTWDDALDVYEREIADLPDLGEFYRFLNLGGKSRAREG
jgi:hypothetical protein